VAETILRLPGVKHRTGLSRSTIYMYISSGTFPSPVPLGPRAVGWLESEVDSWLAAQISRRRGSGSEQPTPRKVRPQASEGSK
jgi:prophage regulatory protein